MQFPGRIPFQAEESGGQRPCSQACLEPLRCDTAAKSLDPSEQTGQEKDEAREELWDQVTDGLLGPGQASVFYSKLVGNHWRVLSRVFYLFIFPSACHPGSSRWTWEICFYPDANEILHIRVLEKCMWVGGRVNGKEMSNFKRSSS